MPNHLKGVGYFSTPNWVIDCGNLLRPREKLVLTYLIRRAGPDGSCFPSIATMAMELGTSQRTVSYGLRGVIGLGIVSREQRKNSDGSLTSSIYTFNAAWRPPENLAKPKRKKRSDSKTSPSNTTEEKAQPMVESQKSSFEPPSANVAVPTKNEWFRNDCSTAIDAGGPAIVAAGPAIVAQEVLPSEVLPNEVQNYIETSSQKKIPNTDHHRFIDWWCKTYEEKFNEKYLFDSGKDGKLVNTMLKTYGYEKLIEMAKDLFNNGDDFADKSGYSLGVFKGCINRIIARKKGPLSNGQQSFFGGNRENPRVLKNVDPGFIKGLTDKFGND